MTPPPLLCRPLPSFAWRCAPNVPLSHRVMLSRVRVRIAGGISSLKLRTMLDFHFTAWQPADVAADAKSGELADERTSAVLRAMTVPFHISGECHRKLMFYPTSHNFGV